MTPCLLHAQALVCSSYLNKTTTDGLGSNNVSGVFASGTTVYAATQGGLGISTDDGASFSNRTTAEGLGSNNVSSVFASGSNVYAGTYGGGVGISTNGGSSFVAKTTADGLGSNNVTGVCAVGNTVYAATSFGLAISANGGSSFTYKTSANGLGSNTLMGVYAVGSTVYAATTGGLSISTNGGNSFTNYTATNGLGNSFVLGVYAVGNTVYAATFSGLSISTNGGTSYTNYTTSNGLGANTVTGVYAVGNTVYAATYNGGFSISTNGGTSFSTYTTANGLGSSSVSGCFATATRLFVATAGGFSYCSACATPMAYEVMGGGNNCPWSLASVGLADSEQGMNYQLKLGTANTGNPVAGTGEAISFGTQSSPGTYSVVATHAANGCTLSMMGDIEVEECPCSPAAFTACPGNQTIYAPANDCTASLDYSALASGFPTPDMTYTFAGATSSNGSLSGTGSGSEFQFGTTNVAITATNACGTPTCNFNVTVNDTVPPIATCQGMNLILDANGAGSITASQINNGSTDNCGTVNLVSVSPNVFHCSHVGANLVTLTVNDGHGNTGTCTASVTVEDRTAPTVNCKPHLIQLNAIGSPIGLVPAQVFGSGSDNCGTVHLASVTPNSFDCSHLGQNNVTLTVNDGHGNTAACTATVSVVDLIPPILNCKSHNVQLSAAGSASIVPADVFGGGDDNCITVNLVSLSQSAFDCSDWGANSVSLLVNDGNGNNSTCTATVTVQDNIAPVVACKPYTVQLGATGSANISPVEVFLSGSDNCGIVNLASVSPNLLTCADLGNNTVTLTVNDGHGNNSTCTATVTVLDNTAPSLACKPHTALLGADGNASIAPSAVLGSGSDNCGTVNLVSVLPNAFNCSHLGANLVTLTVNDGHGNNSACTATVTVQDNIAPMVACIPSLSPALNTEGTVTLTPTQAYLSGSDNCGSLNLQSLSPSTFTCNDEGPNTATLTVNDGHGNTATCTTTVHIQVDFITISGLEVTPESCGEGNGVISISAVALGGQLGYSINGGQSYSFSGQFGGLSAGTYSVAVTAFGTAGCTEYYGAVTVGSAGTSQAWYLDADADGYSNGQNVLACTLPGPDWHLANELSATSGDCNDEDPLEFPGQVWFRDFDKDGYSNGVVLVQCQRPSGFKAQGELLGSANDCNDATSGINPAGAEVCNSIDDNCNNLIDEGTTGGLTYVGSLNFISQAQLDAFSPCYSVIQGNLTVQNSNVSTLLILGNIVKVTGNVLVKNTSLVSMNGLHNLDSIGGNLTINGNNFGSKLQSLDGLEDLDWVGGNLKVYSNSLLADCCAIEGIIGAEPNGVGGSISIYSNAPNMGCQGVPIVLAACGGNAIIAPPTVDGGRETVDGARETAHGARYTVDGARAAHPLMSIFPNPVSSLIGRELRVKIEGNFMEGYLRVYDSTGWVISSQDLPEGTNEWRLQTDGWKTGIYLVQALLDGQALTQKLIVE